MLRRVFAWLPAVLLAASPFASFAQETTGRLEGRVLDPNGEPVASVNVVLSSPALQGNRGAQTDTDGRFVLLSLPIGVYTVKLSHLAYQPRTMSGLQVRLGQTTALGNIKMSDQVYTTEAIEVSGRAAPIDPTSTVTGENLSTRDIATLPVERDYKSVVALLPHANSSSLGDPVNFAGATGLENRFFVDGIDVTDSYRSAAGTNLPYNFVQEIQVMAGGYEAQQRSALGGAVNVVTYSGGNDMTADVFGFFTSNGFSATPRSVPGTPKGNQQFAAYDFGFGVGGPIAKDRLWYYAAYNPSFATEDVVIPGFGSYEDRVTTHSLAGKLTWHANDANTFVMTTVGDPTEGRQVNAPVVAPAVVDPFLFEIRQGGVSAALEGRHLIGKNLLLRSSLSRSSRKESSIPETKLGRTEPIFVDSTGVVSGGGSRTENESGVTAAALHATWFRGDHEVKAGAEYRDTRLEFDTRTDIVLQSSAVTYYYQSSLFKGHVGSRAPSAYLQDSWRPTTRLQLNGGLRWDGWYWISSEDKVAQTILDGWQPRLGVTYQPGRLSSQKVFATAGRFYQDVTTAPLFWYYNTGSSFFSANYDHDPRLDFSGADTLGVAGGRIQPSIKGLEGQYFDEFVLGYERMVNEKFKFAVRGMRRMLRQGLEDGIDLNTFEVGLSNPGLGALRTFPKMKRNYTALEVSGQGQVSRSLTVLASYVYSQNDGNYEGLFDSRLNNPYPNATGLYDVVYQFANGDGLLPNDRTHVLKLSGSWRATTALTIGTVALAESGTPVSEFGGTPVGQPYGGFIGKRGSHGRTPAVWDLNFRISYEPAIGVASRFRPRVTADVFHVASRRKAVRYDEVHYYAFDDQGNQINPNPNWGMPTAFRPPMAVRLGFQAGW